MSSQGQTVSNRRWGITGMGALGNAIQGGLIFWSLGLYMSAFEDHFGASRASITLIETMITVGVNTMSIFVGAWVDRRSARHLVAVGCGALGVGLILVSYAGTLLQIWVVFLTVISLGILAVGVVPSSAIISRWFRKRRGLALGISVTGSSIGGFLAPPIITWLFLTYGWQMGLRIGGIFAILMAPVFFMVLVNRPEDVGQSLETTDDESGKPSGENWTILEIIQTRTLWLQVLITGTLLGVTLGILANLGLHAKDLGVVGQQTASLYSIIALISLGGKVAFGAVIDRFGVKCSGAITVALMISAMTLLVVGETYSMLLVSSVAMGCAIGGVMPLWTSLSATGFGPNNVGRTMGLHNPLHMPITAPSAPLAGYISDTTGSYDMMFMVYAGAAAVAGVALYFLQQPKRPKNSVPPFMSRWVRNTADAQ